jgi:hypothetical protein
MLEKLKIVAVLFLFVFSSCKKENKEPLIRPDSIIIGDYTDMVRHTYDTVIYYQGNGSGIDLDIDNDNTGDVRLVSEMWGSVGLGHHPRSQIMCLNKNVSLSGYLTSDTTFFYLDRNIVPWSDSIVHVDEISTFSCHSINVDDTILDIAPDRFKISAKRLYDKINQEDTFKSDSVILIDESYLYPPLIITKQDTVIYKYESFFNDCNIFPQNSVSYIGLRIMNGNGIKYGWVKLSVVDNNKIIIFETAIQQ